MFAVKNSIKNIYRYKNKYILFGILYLILISSAAVCMNIFVQMGQVTDNILNEYAGVARITGRVSGNSGAADAARPSKNDILGYANIKHVRDIKLSGYNFNTTSIKENVPELTTELHTGGKIIELFAFRPVLVLGCNMALLHLEENSFNFESGRMFENSGEAAITKNMLDMNHGGWNDLDIGDKIIIKNDGGIYKEFTVTGILEQNPGDVENTNRWMIYTAFEDAEYFDYIADESVENLIITSPDYFGEHIDSSKFVRMGYDALIYADHPENYWDLRNNMYDAGVFIEPLFPNFRALTGLTQNMQAWSVILAILTSIIIISVTVITTLILMSSRKYEIAVLRSVGMKKTRLIINYLIENLAFILGTGVISLVTAQFISPVFSRGAFAGMRDLLSTEMFEQLTRGANLGLILPNAGFVFAGTIAVTTLSLALACVSIIRFEPLKIFNSRY